MTVVETAVDGVIGRVKLARPEKRNALSHATVDELDAAFADFAAAGARIAVLSAGGPVFCAGADLDEFGGPPPHASERLMDLLATADLFVIAVVEAPAFGAGVGLLAACPIVLATSDTWFSLPERTLGLFPAGVLSQLESVVPPRRAFELGLTGGRWDAESAQRLGLVTEVVEPRDLNGTLERWLDRLREDPQVAAQAGAAWRGRFLTDAFKSRRRDLDHLVNASMSALTASSKDRTS